MVDESPLCFSNVTRHCCGGGAPHAQHSHCDCQCPCTSPALCTWAVVRAEEKGGCGRGQVPPCEYLLCHYDLMS